MKRIVHWTIKVTWKDEMNNRYEEYLDDIPPFKDIENYLDELEADRNEKSIEFEKDMKMLEDEGLLTIVEFPNNKEEE